MLEFSLNDMQGAGFEPAKALGHRVLNPARLTGLRHPCATEKNTQYSGSIKIITLGIE